MTTDNAVTPAVSRSTPQFVDPAELKPAQLKADIERARTELAATLDAIEFKLNLPKKLRAVQRTANRKIAVVRDENPSALIAGAIGAASAVGLIVWGVVRIVAEHSSDPRD